MGLREAVWLDGDLDPALPLLLPRVLHLPVVVCLQRLVVRELHRGDQVLPEQLQNQIFLLRNTNCKYFLMTNVFLIGKKILNTFKISTDRLRDGAVGPPVAGLGVLVLGVRPGSARHGAAAPPPVPPLRGVRHLVAALESFY